MASTQLELAMAESIKSLLEITQELQLTNCKHNRNVQKLGEENIRKQDEIQKLQNMLNIQEQELIETRLENSILKRQLVHFYNTRTSSSKGTTTQQQKSELIKLLVRTSCMCSFGFLFGLAEDDEKFK